MEQMSVVKMRVQSRWESMSTFSAFLMDQRYPLAGMIALALWAPLSGLPGIGSVASNVRLVGSYLQLCVYAFLSLLAMVFLESIRRLLSSRSEEELSQGSASHSPTWSTSRYVCISFGALIGPWICWWYTRSQALDVDDLQQISKAWSWVGWFKLECQGWVFVDYLVGPCVLLLGIAAGWLVMMLLGRLRSEVLGSRADTCNYFPFEARDRGGLWGKTKLVAGRRDDAIEIQLWFYVFVMIFAFFLLRPLESQVDMVLLSVPSFLTMLVWGSAMIIAGIDDKLRQSKLPVLISMLIAIVLMQLLLKPSSTFDTISRQTESDASVLVHQFQELSHSSAQANALSGETQYDRQQQALTTIRTIDDIGWTAVKARMGAAPMIQNKKTLIVVTCPGGGIHAAAWATYVLEKLQERYPNFKDSIAIISGVSGGSVGTMFYCSENFLAGSKEAKSPQTKSQPLASWKLATESCLEAVGAGLTFDDAPGLLIPFLVGADRGERLEATWRERSNHVKDATFDQWAERATQGTMPIVVLNSTDAASGRRVQFSSILCPLRPSLLNSPFRAINHREMLEGANWDVRVSSGARASASFPYVSPFIRPLHQSPYEKAIALGDGGYIDNEGIETAVEWINFLASRNSQSEKVFSRILLLRIQPSTVDNAIRKENLVVSSLRWLTGPLEAIANMRSTAQVDRGDLEVELSTNYIDNEWWKENATVAMVPKIEPDETDVPALAMAPKPPKDDSARRDLEKVLQRQARIDSMIKSDLSNKVEFKKTPPSSSTQSESSQSSADTPKSQTYAGEPIADTLSYPVLEFVVPFLITDVEIPLNWKLSEKQKRFYPAAWQTLESMTIPNGDTTSPFFQQLDELLGPPTVVKH